MGNTYVLRKGVSELDDLADGQAAHLPFTGQAYWLDPATGSDTNSGKKPTEAFKTLPTAYAALTANQNDVLYYIAGSTSLTNLSAAFTWAKSYTHFIGVCAPTRVGQRARIFQLSTLTGASPLITISGNGCVFQNLYAFQGVDDATSLVNVSVTGARNYFENVHFAGGGHATQAVDGGASLLLNGGSENTFRHCTIGVDTIAAATGMAGLLLDGAAARNVFESCNFTMYAGNAGAIFVEVVDSAGFDRYVIFRDCLFINDAAATTLTSAFAIPAGMGSATHRILLYNCAFVGAADVDSNNRGLCYLNTGTTTGGGNAGLFVVSNST